MGVVREMIDDHVERLTLPDPVKEFRAEKGAYLFERLGAVGILLASHRAVDFAEGVLAGGGHTPGEEPAAVEIGP